MVQTERETGALRGQFARQVAVQASAAVQAESARAEYAQRRTSGSAAPETEELLCAPEPALPPEPAQPAWKPETRKCKDACNISAIFRYFLQTFSSPVV